jgi:hypothetical protein
MRRRSSCTASSFFFGILLAFLHFLQFEVGQFFQGQEAVVLGLRRLLERLVFLD